MRIRTGYSFRTAVGHLRDVADRLKEIGWTAAPISDRFSTFGFTRWTKEATKRELRPVYGVEIGVVEARGEKKPTVDYWTFFAKDDIRDIHELIRIATSEATREPVLTYEEAMAASGVIRIAGERARLNCFDPMPDLYIGLSPSISKGFYNVVADTMHQWIATGDNLYPRPTDKEFYRVALGHRSGTQTYPQHILSDEEWLKSVGRISTPAVVEDALARRSSVLDSCRAKLPKATLLTPEKAKSLRQMCEEGAARTGTNLNDPVYAARLNRELGLIAEKKYEDYFYIITDMVQWAKKKMIVGPARGSSCGSLVCFLLDITTIDPIPYGLIFERFIDINRSDLPDIDIDFSDERRKLVFEYIEGKYGKDRVARLGTVGMFKPRSALKQAGIALRVPSWKIDKVLDGLIERTSGDSRAMFALEDTLKDTEAGRSMLEEFPEVMIAARMEGHPAIASQHAAGIIITQEPVNNYVAVDARSGAIMADKKDAETLNLLKVDALGLTQLSIFERTLELIGQPTVSGWLEKLPLDDPAAFAILNNGFFSGIFQFTGKSLQLLTKLVKVESIEDIIAITALARPGPIATGGTNAWARRKNGLEPVSYITPLMEELTKNTFGVITYQEQVMMVVRTVGQLSWEDTSAIRKAMSGTWGDEYFRQFRIKFMDGAMRQGVPEETADAIWKQINTFGSWAFNRSHAVAYGTVSYWCCWLKAHHPVEFAAATLDAEPDPIRQIEILRELKAEGIDYVPVDPDRSTAKWVPGVRNGRKMLLGPLTAVKGIGPATVALIIAARKDGEMYNTHDDPEGWRQLLRPGVAKKLLNLKTPIDTLYPVAEAVARLHPDLTAINIHSKPVPIKEVQLETFAGHSNVMIIAVIRRIAPRDENEAQLVVQRGRKLEGPTQALNLFVYDDTDEMFCKIGRYAFEEIGRPVSERGKQGRAIYAIKGKVPRGFRMIDVQQIRYLGDLDGEAPVAAEPPEEVVAEAAE